MIFRSNHHFSEERSGTAKTPRRQGKAIGIFSYSWRLGVLAVTSISFFVGGIASGGTDSVVAPPPARRGNQPIANEITPEQQAAVEKGLEYLASRQNAEGSFGNAGAYGATAAITALSGIAFMADGNLPGRGKYGDNVKKAVQFIVRNQQESGLFTTSAFQGEMY